MTVASEESTASNVSVSMKNLFEKSFFDSTADEYRFLTCTNSVQDQFKARLYHIYSKRPREE